MPSTELIEVIVHTERAPPCPDCDAAREKCIACEKTKCAWHRGYDKDSYVTWGHRKGYACCLCIEAGKAAHNSFADRAGLQSIEARVNRMLDAKLQLIKTDVAPTLIQIAVEQIRIEAEKLATSAQGNLDESLKSVNKALEKGAATVKDAVDHLNPSKLLWQTGLVIGLVNMATIIAVLLAKRFL